jgi:hypothetical protein
LLLGLGPCRRAICIRSYGPFLNTLVGIHMLCCTIGLPTMWTSSDSQRIVIHDAWWLFTFFWYTSGSESCNRYPYPWVPNTHPYPWVNGWVMGMGLDAWVGNGWVRGTWALQRLS